MHFALVFDLLEYAGVEHILPFDSVRIFVLLHSFWFEFCAIAGSLQNQQSKIFQCKRNCIVMLSLSHTVGQV